MSKARDLANAGTALGAVSPTELGYVDGVTSAIQTQLNAKEATLPDQTGNSGKYLTTDGSTKSWGTVSQYALPTQTGNSGKFLTTNGTTESWGTITLPVTWTARKGAGSTGINAIASNGSTIYVGVGYGGYLASSTDGGITWTDRTSGFGSNPIYSVAYGNGIFVAVGAAGTLTTSTDGVTWTARTSTFGANDIYKVDYLNGLFVAGGSLGGTNAGIASSSDGITWTQRLNASGNGGFTDFAYGGGYYLAVASSPNWTDAAYSTNGTSWTAFSIGSNIAITFVLYANSTWIVGNNSSAAYYTTSNPTTGWTNLNAASQFYAISDGHKKTLSNNLVYMVPTSNTNLNPPNFVNSFVPAVSNSSVTGYGTPILPPTAPGSFTCIYSSSKGFVIGNANGYIFTSF